MGATTPTKRETPQRATVVSDQLTTPLALKGVDHAEPRKGTRLLEQMFFFGLFFSTRKSYESRVIRQLPRHDAAIGHGP